MEAQCLTVNKSLLGVVPASSGVSGNIDATYLITVINPAASACPFVLNIDITEQFSAISNLGPKFVRVVGLPSIAVTGVSVSPTLNPAYNGGTTPGLTNIDGLLFQDDSIFIQITAEMNPRAVGGTLNNTVFANYIFPPSAGAVSATASIPNCWSNCQLACNNTIHLSVNSLCEASLVAEMVLEGTYSQECLDLGFYTVSLTSNGKPVTMPISRSYIGKNLVVTVSNIVCGNSCWGNVILEDKVAPALQCRARDSFRCNVNLNPSVFGFPVNPIFVNQSVYPYIVTGIDACGTATLTYKDSVVSYSCIDTLASTVYRRWCATDPSGFTSCCVDTIDIIRGTLADLTLPPHYDGQPGNQPYLRCNGSWTKFPNGYPDTSSTGTGRPQGLLCGNIQFDFSDDTIRVCDGSFKLLRKWLLIDWCRPNNRITYIQLIKVVDDVAPVITCPTTLTINTDPHVCTGSYTLPVPEVLVPGKPTNTNTPYVIEACSRWTYTVLHRPATSPSDCTPDPLIRGNSNNIVQLPNGQYKVVNMPYGCNWIYYRICDDCGNCTECTFDIEVKDLTPPVPVCQQRTVVALTDNGQATVPATIFDDRSFDNCQMGSFQVRRMNPGSCGSTTFSSTQTFCCADIAASPIRVVLRVIDAAGNSSECMVDVMVQDKLPPKITCPKDTVISCETDISNLNVFGNASAKDNCSFTTATRVENNLSSCNIGVIKRWFVVTDAGGRKDSCFQSITIRDTMPFRESDITFPSDIVISGCKNSTNPDQTGKPIFRNQDKCNQIITNYEDLVFNYVEGVCFKILRKWTVIDWCNYNIINPEHGNGVWYHTQVIKIVNNVAPTFTSSCANRELCITDGCTITAVLSAAAFDDCTTDPNELKWKYEFDRNNDGSINNTGTTKSFSPSLGQGTHKITWTVNDQCGNSSTCSYLINVRDCKAPTPYCNPGIITVIMPTTREVTVWAKDFNLASTDNCTEQNKLYFSFTANVKDSFKTIRCADLSNGRVDTIDIDIYVTDLSGNQDVCHTKLIVQDNQDVCPNSGTLTGNVSGLVTHIDANKKATNVSVQFYEVNSGNMLDQQVTDLEGKYAFKNILVGEQYLIQPTLNYDFLNGVSTRDIVEIQKHILGKKEIQNPYYLIAADVNKSGTITSKDISDIRKLILGLVSEFPNNNPSWNFVDSKVNMTKENAFSFSSEISLVNLQGDLVDNNFIAIKSGDVTGEANTSSYNTIQSRSNSIVGLEVTEIQIENGSTYTLPVSLNSVSTFNGFQLELTLDSRLAKFKGLESGTIALEANNYSILENGSKLRISWNDNQLKNLNQGEQLFNLILEANNEGIIDAQSLKLSNKNLNSEIYTVEFVEDLKLLFRSANGKSTEKYELYQNVPNPFNGKTTIFFKLPTDENVALHVYDLAGRKLKSLQVEGKKGLNTVELEMLNNEAGLLYYQLDANNFIATRKMVIIR